MSNNWCVDPEAVAVLEFYDAALAVNPQRAGMALFGPLAARRGTYRAMTYTSTEASAPNL